MTVTLDLMQSMPDSSFTTVVEEQVFPVHPITFMTVPRTRGGRVHAPRFRSTPGMISPNK